jgi:hypothetical protein
MRQPFARTLALSLALCAMLLRGLMPVGWMPSAEAAPFVICSIDGTHSGGKAPSDPAHERSHAPCAFAAAAHLAPPVLGMAGLAAPALVHRLVFTATKFAVARQSLYRPNVARAPPAFS